MMKFFKEEKMEKDLVTTKKSERNKNQIICEIGRLEEELKAALLKQEKLLKEILMQLSKLSEKPS